MPCISGTSYIHTNIYTYIYFRSIDIDIPRRRESCEIYIKCLSVSVKNDHLGDLVIDGIIIIIIIIIIIVIMSCSCSRFVYLRLAISYRFL
jgi:hypothetical protein